MSVQDKNMSLALRSIAGGGMSASISTLCFQPLDLLKTQVQELAIKKECRPRFLVPSVCMHIFENHGVFGFWKGLSASLLRNVPGIALYFGTLNTLMSIFPRDKYSTLELSLVAGSSRAIVATVLFPFAFMKTRFESQKFSYGGLFPALKIISKTEGRLVFYRGYVPTMARDIPFSAIYLPFYSAVKNGYAQAISPEFAHSNLGHFSAGCIAGSGAAILTQPADVIKTHMQLEPKRFPTLCKTVYIIIMLDGFGGLFRGSLLRLARRTTIAAFNWSIFEHLVGEITPTRSKI